MAKKSNVQLQRQPDPELVFPACQGMQGNRYYWMSRFAYSDLERLFKPFFENRSAQSSDLAQRSLNTARAKKISHYAVDAAVDGEFYIIPPLIVLAQLPAGGEFWFEEFSDESGSAMSDVGYLILPGSTKLWIPDGQHRAMGLILASRAAPNVFENETVGVMLLADEDTELKQRIFLDINNNSAKPNKSIVSWMDHRDEWAAIAREIAQSNYVFQGRTALEAVNVSPKSKDLVTINNLREASKLLLSVVEPNERLATAHAFWRSVADNNPIWQTACKLEDTAPLRSSTIAFNAISLNALAIVGSMLIEDGRLDRLKKLKVINWDADNPDWNQLIRFGGRIVKNGQTTRGLADYIYQRLH